MRALGGLYCMNLDIFGFAKSRISFNVDQRLDNTLRLRSSVNHISTVPTPITKSLKIKLQKIKNSKTKHF